MPEYSLHRNLLTLINNSLNEWNPTNGLEEIVEEILEKQNRFIILYYKDWKR